jgi:hypothetical protein
MSPVRRRLRGILCCCGNAPLKKGAIRRNSPPSAGAIQRPSSADSNDRLVLIAVIRRGKFARRLTERASELLRRLGQSPEPVVVLQQGEAALVGIAHAAKPPNISSPSCTTMKPCSSQHGLDAAVGMAREDSECTALLVGQLRHCTPVRLSCRGCSFQFGRASAPTPTIRRVCGSQESAPMGPQPALIGRAARVVRDQTGSPPLARRICPGDGAAGLGGRPQRADGRPLDGLRY